MTVGELKAILADVPDDVRIASYGLDTSNFYVDVTMGETICVHHIDDVLFIGHDEHCGAFVYQDVRRYVQSR